VFTGRSDTTFTDLVRALVACHKPTRSVLWDLQACRFGDATQESLRAAVDELVAALGQGRAGGRSAFVLGRKVDFGMMRMMISYVETRRYRVSLRAFQDLEAARVWLLDPPSPE